MIAITITILGLVQVTTGDLPVTPFDHAHITTPIFLFFLNSNRLSFSLIIILFLRTYTPSLSYTEISVRKKKFKNKQILSLSGKNITTMTFGDASKWIKSVNGYILEYRKGNQMAMNAEVVE